MAYNTKYRFRFVSLHGVEYRILVQKNGYSGSIIDRALGRAPVIKRKHSGRVFGTSVEFFAECQVDGEFAEFYTSDPTEFKVQVYHVNHLVWSGYLSPELYSEPDIAPRYDVHVIATDGLGELKLHNFEALGDVTLQSLFSYLLAWTGLSVTTTFVSSLSATAADGDSVSASNFFGNTYINLDYMAGKTCYEVLQYVLDTLCACITMQDAGWLIWRENDITSTDVAAADVTAMDGGGLWPVGHMTRKVEPAKKVVSVEAPYHLWTILLNPDMTEDYGWSKTRYAYISSEGAYRVTPHEWAPQIDFDALAQSVLSYADKEYNLEVTFDPHLTINGTAGALAVFVSFTPDGLSALYLSRKNDGTLEWRDWGHSHIPLLQPGVSGTPSTMTLHIPPITNQGYTGLSGILRIRLSFRENISRPGYGGAIYSCFLNPIGLPYGYKDILNINNGARGEGGSVGIAHGRITTDIDTAYNGFLRGVFKASDEYFLVTFKDRIFTADNQEFLSLTAKNYARLVAASRIRLTGILDIPSTLSVLPMLLNLRSVYYLVETYTWDLYNDELEVSALSLPDGNLSIASETIINTTKAAAASGASGAGGEGSGSGGGGVSLLNVWRSLTNNDELASFDANTKIAAGHLPATFFIEETYTEGGVSKKRLKLNPDYTGLYADGFISAAGIGSGGGGGGGASELNDLDDVTISSPSSGQFLKYDGTSWVNSTVGIGDLSNVSLSSSTNGQVLKYNGTNWVNAYLGLGDLGNVTLSSPTNGQVLKYNGTNWVDAYLGLGDLGNVTLNSPTNGQVLKYNGTNWVNAADAGGETNVIEIVQLNGTALTVTKKTVNVEAATSATLNGETINLDNGVLALGNLLPKTGGELTGDLWLHSNSANYGSKLWFGDKGSGDGYVYLHEDSDDHLTIYADRGILLRSGSRSDSIITCANKVIPSTGSLDLGDTSHSWRYLYAKRWYPDYDNASGVYAEYSTNNNAVTIHGNLVVTGQVVSGQAGSGSSFPLDVSGNLVPTQNNQYTVGTTSMKFSAVYATTIGGTGANKVSNIYATQIGGTQNPVSSIYASEIFVEYPSYIAEWSGFASYVVDYPSGTSGNDAEEDLGVDLTDNRDLNDIVAGRKTVIKSGNYVFAILTVTGTSSDAYIYIDGPYKRRLRLQSNASWSLSASW